MATKLKASRHDNSYYILEDTPFINLLQVPCHPRRLIFFCILFFGGDPARSCEGRTVPSMPPLPWPMLLCFNFKWVLIFENIVCEGTCSQFSLEVLVIANLTIFFAKPKSEPATTPHLLLVWRDRSNLLSQFLSFSRKNSFSKIFVRFSFPKRFIEVEALLGLSKALIRFIHQPQT